MADATKAIHQPQGHAGRVTMGVAASTTLYGGIGVSLAATGYVQQMGDDVETIFIGVVEPAGQDTIDNSAGAADAKKVNIQTHGTARFGATSPDATWIGRNVYAVDNQTVALATGVTNAVLVGVCVGFETAHVTVLLTPGAKPAPFVFAFPIALAQITGAGDVVTTITPGFRGVIKKVYAVVDTVVTTAAKAATLNLEVNATDVTGGTVALTSANCTPLGARIDQGAAPSAGHRFDENDTLSVEAAAVTAFAEGRVTLYVEGIMD